VGLIVDQRLLGGLLADLVHILRVRRRSLRLVASGGWAASTFVGETLTLFLIAFVLELLAFIHDLDTRTARAISHPAGAAVLSSWDRNGDVR